MSDSAPAPVSLAKSDKSEAALLKQVVLPINHCNLPSWLLASLQFQQHPVPIEIDGVSTWFSDLFDTLSTIECSKKRALHFADFMEFRFRLNESRASANWQEEPPPRPKVNYRKLVLGWLFDSDNDQGAAWRSWVESRFGLLTQFHQQPLSTPEAYHGFRYACARAVYGTNELDTQLDLLYSYCQLELAVRYPNSQHIRLYRGCTELPEHQIAGKAVKLFNNLSSFTLDPEDAFRFGSKLYAVDIPLAKVVCFDSLLPNSLSGEKEFMVLGGLYHVELLKL